MSAIFHQIFIFHQKLWKMFFISSKKLFSFSKYSNFCIFIFPSFFPPGGTGATQEKKITVYFISFSGWLAKSLTKWSPWCIQGMEIHLWAYIYQNISICWKVILWLSCEILTLNIHETPDSDFFWLFFFSFFSIFGLWIRYFGLL